ncbi:MAG TPA: flagellar hook-basal body complex protein FliE [Candidatus Limnocylindria bacterium]|nr:flagellar hook-basal body complex protein FliE [Candidatus Limnocylindria bacterium]
MNPLSSIRQIIPSAGQMPMPGAGAIPVAELEKLASTGELPKLSGSQNSSSFSGVLEKMVSEVNQKQAAAGQSVHDLQNGQTASLHQTMIALEEASVSFQLMVEVRNKVLESYQELMRMQV